MPTQLNATATSMVNSNRDKLQQQIIDINNEIQALQPNMTYIKNKIQYEETIIDRCNDILNMPGFHPIQKAKAKLMQIGSKQYKSSYELRLSSLISKEQSLQMKLSHLQIKDSSKEFKNENKQHRVGNSFIPVKDGKIDFSSKKGQLLTQNLFDPKTNLPTQNFETLKQLLVDYPKSITTLPDNIIQELDSKQVKVRQIQATSWDGKYQMIADRQMTGFEYIKGMAAAGFTIAEQQGRTMQANDNAKVEFADWVNDKEQMLNKIKSSKHKTHTYQKNPNQTEAQFI